MVEKKASTEEREKAPAKPKVADKLEAARERFTEVAAGVEKKVQRIRDTAGRASQQLKEGAGKASEVAREKVGQAREVAQQSYERVSKDFSQLSRDVSEYVRQNPGKSVAIAAGAGFLLGLLLRGRRRE